MIPILKSSSTRTRDRILYVLAMKETSTAKKIFNTLKRDYNADVTYQAVHKTLKQMVDEGILECESNQYGINADWIKEVKSFLGLVEDQNAKNSFEVKIKEILFSLKDQQVEMFDMKNLNEVIHFLKLFEEVFFLNYELDEPIFMKLIYNFAVLDPDFVSRDHGRYVVCLGDSILDNIDMFKGEYSHYFLRSGAENINENIIVYGNYVISIMISKSMIEDLKAYFNSIEAVEDFDFAKLKQIMHEKDSIIVQVQKNSFIADFYKREIEQIYLEPFKGLLEDWKQQRKEGKQLSIASEWKRITLYQEFRDQVVEEQEGVKKIPHIETSMVSCFLPELRNHILQHEPYHKERSILVELAMGTAQKTEILLKSLVKRVNHAIEYHAIDASKRVLDKAEEILSDIHNVNITFHCMRLKDFAKTDKKKKPKFIFSFGAAFSSMKIENVDQLFDEMVSENDKLCLRIRTYPSDAERKPAEAFNARNRKPNSAVLRELGISEQNLHSEVVQIVDEHGETIRLFTMKIKEEPKFLLPKLKEIGIQAGEKIEVHRAWLPNFEEIKRRFKDKYYLEQKSAFLTLGYLLLIPKKAFNFNIKVKTNVTYADPKTNNFQRSFLVDEMVERGRVIYHMGKDNFYHARVKCGEEIICVPLGMLFRKTRAGEAMEPNCAYDPQSKKIIATKTLHPKDVLCLGGVEKIDL